MIIKVGTRNKVKVQAVREIAAEYALGHSATVIGIDVPSTVPDQPKSLMVTSTGAVCRAKNAFGVGDDCDLAIGIESGLMKAPYTRSGFVNFTVVAIYDGENICVGHSTGFEVPPVMLKALEEGEEIDKIVYDLGISDVPNIGKVQGGFLGILTKNRVSRQEYTKQALRMAMIPLENKELFSKPARKPDPRKTCGSCNHERSGCQLHDSVEWMREYWGTSCPYCVKPLPEGEAGCDCGFYLTDLGD
jgi:inosine/xanthosine triphosphatase